ncbi:MAG TPA: ABC transporter ATP-binding protein [Candidatus Limnocylindrales bacterium]|nr:ABC transporter ATP-binding protein [Candidatus Limnocylindrales bacterium]
MSSDAPLAPPSGTTLPDPSSEPEARPDGPLDDTEALVDVQGLTKVYSGGVRALDGIELRVGRGEIVGFLGPNGAGKTTTVMLLIGAIRPTAGEGTVLGRPLGDRQARRELGYLPEQFQFPGFLAPDALLDLHGRLLGLDRNERRRRASELLALVGLESVARRAMRTFSKGMLQRVGLAQALLGRPRLLLLDEPTSGLDPIGTRAVRDLLLWLKASGTAVVLNSHLLSEVELVCDRVAIIDRGRIVARGPLTEILAPTSLLRFRARGLDDGAAQQVAAITADLRPLDDGWWEARLGDPADVPRIARAIVAGGADLEALVPASETLEQAFFRLVGR